MGESDWVDETLYSLICVIKIYMPWVLMYYVGGDNVAVIYQILVYLQLLDIQ